MSPLSESPLRLRLSWKKSPNDPARLVGIFDLDLSNSSEVATFVMTQTPRVKFVCASTMTGTI